MFRNEKTIQNARFACFKADCSELLGHPFSFCGRLLYGCVRSRTGPCSLKRATLHLVPLKYASDLYIPFTNTACQPLPLSCSLGRHDRGVTA